MSTTDKERGGPRSEAAPTDTPKTSSSYHIAQDLQASELDELNARLQLTAQAVEILTEAPGVVTVEQ